MKLTDKIQEDLTREEMAHAKATLSKKELSMKAHRIWDNGVQLIKNTSKVYFAMMEFEEAAELAPTKKEKAEFTKWALAAKAKAHGDSSKMDKLISSL
jgi:hypothetical protein